VWSYEDEWVFTPLEKEDVKWPHLILLII
jgi:hypothetical protein